MIRTSAIAAAVLLASCASVDASSYRQSAMSAAEGLTPQDVSTGFGIAVVDGCAAAAEAGKTLEQLGSDRIVPGQGIVAIEQGEGKCEVSAYGPPVESTFNAIVAALHARGYTSQPIPSAGFNFFRNDLTMTANGRTVHVMLVGNEPGAAGMRSRFSILSAYVGATTP